jgi:hypothetical protein
MRITKIHFAASAALVVAKHVCEDFSEPNKKAGLGQVSPDFYDLSQ